MPIYEYRCEACGTQEERLEAFSAPEQHECTACGVPEGMKRQLSVAAFALGGGGWFSEGYTGKGGAKAEAAPAPAAPAPTTGGGCGGGCACH